MAFIYQIIIRLDPAVPASCNQALLRYIYALIIQVFSALSRKFRHSIFARIAPLICVAYRPRSKPLSQAIEEALNTAKTLVFSGLQRIMRAAMRWLVRRHQATTAPVTGQAGQIARSPADYRAQLSATAARVIRQLFEPELTPCEKILQRPLVLTIGIAG